MAESLSILNWWDYLAIFLITFVGLPHGAFDAAVGMSVGFYNDTKRKLFFLLSYLSLSLIVVLLWYFFSELVLIIFLLASIFHFGLGEMKWENKITYYLSGYFNGGIVILGISFFHFSEVSQIYSALVGYDPTYLWSFLKMGAVLWCLLLPLHIIFNWSKFDKNYILCLLLTSFFIIFLPPLLGFSFYFCFIHSVNHIRRIVPALKTTQSRKNIFKIFLIFTILSWILGLIFFYLLIQVNSITESLLYITFVGLAALTFPHMILIDMIFRPKLKI